MLNWLKESELKYGGLNGKNWISTKEGKEFFLL